MQITGTTGKEVAILHNKVEAANFRDEVDQWIKSFKRGIDLFSNDMDDLSDEFEKQREEHLMFYENLDRVERKIETLQESFDKVASLLKADQRRVLSNITPLRNRG